MIKTLKNKIYTGISTDIERRFLEHAQRAGKGAKFFYSDTPLEIIYFEVCLNRSEATKRELKIKKMTRGNKEKLVEYYLNPLLDTQFEAQLVSKGLIYLPQKDSECNH